MRSLYIILLFHYDLSCVCIVVLRENSNHRLNVIMLPGTVNSVVKNYGCLCYSMSPSLITYGDISYYIMMSFRWQMSIV